MQNPIAVFVLVLVSIPVAAHADYLAGFTGNTSPGVLVKGTSLKGTVNFAVLDMYKGKRGDTWGTGYANMEDTFVPGEDAWGYSSPSIDGTARYLYIYQVVND